MASLNKIILIGSLTNNPDFKTTNEGISFARFVLSVDRLDSERSQTKQMDLFKIITWRNEAEKIRESNKGDFLLIEGQILQNSFVDEKEQRQWVTEIEAREIRLLSTIKNNNTDTEKPLSKEKVIEEKKKKNIDFDFGDEEISSLNSVPDFTLEAEEDIPF